MSVDIFDFWSPKEIGPNDHVHPKDHEVFQRMANLHSFELDCPPYPFFGPLRSAKVVLLYLSPGFDDLDRKDAKDPRHLDWIVRNRSGNQDLPSQDESEGTWPWWKSRTKDFGTCEELRSKIAILNIGAYHSTEFKDHWILSALPSSRVSIDWAQNVLFPQAEKGEKVVVCLRSAKYWGLDVGTTGRKFGDALFAPLIARSGHMQYTNIEAKKLRDEIIERVKFAIGKQ